MANKSVLKPTRMETQRNRTHDAWREIVDSQAKARNEKLARLTHARQVREAELAGLPVPEPVAPKKTKKARKKK